MNPRNDNQQARALFEILTVNHAGVLSHLVGLFARRACNLESIVCLPTGDGRTSRLWITIEQADRARQMARFVANLEDVLAVQIHRVDALSPPAYDALLSAADGLKAAPNARS